LTATVTATAATNGYQQRPPTAHNTHAISDTSAYATPEKRKVAWLGQGSAALCGVDRQLFWISQFPGVASIIVRAGGAVSGIGKFGRHPAFPIGLPIFVAAPPG
jgi:hypothetical protein